MIHPANVDVAVLLLFFNRPEPFGQVFAEVKKARPSRLFLYQDGPRGERDMAGIEACRKIAADIDWECDVHRLYQEKNYGCDPSEYISQKWAFSLADKCIVLEDDDVPSQTFFPFCKEMLDRYENDERIVLISGFNVDEKTPDVPYDYFFTSIMSIWGWASWRRVIDQWDEHYTFLDDEYNMHQLRQVVKKRGYRDTILKMCYDHRALGKAYYESIFWACMMFNNGLAITPTCNMVNNLGPIGDSTHYAGSLDTIPRRLRKLFTMRRFDIAFPLKHPRYVIENMDYKDHFYRVSAYKHPWRKIGYSLEELAYNLRYGNFSHIWRSMKNRIIKLAGLKKYS